MAEDENCPERCFMEEAKEILQTRRNNVLVQRLENTDLNKSSSGDSSESNSVPRVVVVDMLDKNLDEEGKLKTPKFYYFYQAEYGQHIYLHAIYAKMLERSYGSLEFAPKILRGRILEKGGGSMTEELRTKMRYLEHLPVTCQFEVAEIKLSEPVVDKETLAHFKEQVETRRKKRQRRAKEEKRREKRIEMEENKRIGRYDSPDLRLESRDQFPDVKESHDMFPEFLDHRQRTELDFGFSFPPSERSLSPDLSSSVSSMSLENAYSGPSFATMLAREKKSFNQSLSASVKSINVTGSMSLNINPSGRRRPSVPEGEDFEPVPDFNLSFGDALAQALVKGLEDGGENDNNDAGKKKKKKNKQKLLFSTSMAFPGN